MSTVDPSHSSRLIMVTAGDVTIDWLLFDLDRWHGSRKKEPNFPREAEVAVMKGGAWFLANCIRYLCNCRLRANLFSYASMKHGWLRTYQSTRLFNTFAEFRAASSGHQRFHLEPIPKLVFEARASFG